MAKITFIGAGSTVFAKNLLGDIFSFPELADSHIALMDIDQERLKTSEIVANKVAEFFSAKPVIKACTGRREALENSDYVISMFQVGGFRPSTVIDFEIPKKYGLRQTIADTLGIGGIMRGLRSIPVFLDICRDMEELCPDALFLQYVNPMAMNTWAINKASKIKTVGLCHSVQGTAAMLARDLSIPFNEINYLCAGINHMAFYLKFEHKGQDLYPALQNVYNNKSYGRRYRNLADHVRFEIFRRFGYFVTESSEHFSEYVPWFIKQNHPELLEKFEIPLDEYIVRCELQIQGWETLKKRYESGDLSEIRHNRSNEYGALIIHSMETGEPRIIYGNVQNDGLIDNLPACCVEVPCIVDKNGIQPTKIGKIPLQLAALMQTNINVQSLVVEAALTKKREYIYHAAMLDPHTAAELSLEQIWNLVDELIEAHGNMLPEYS